MKIFSSINWEKIGLGLLGIVSVSISFLVLYFETTLNSFDCILPQSENLEFVRCQQQQTRIYGLLKMSPRHLIVQGVEVKKTVEIYSNDEDYDVYHVYLQTDSKPVLVDYFIEQPTQAYRLVQEIQLFMDGRWGRTYQYSHLNLHKYIEATAAAFGVGLLIYVLPLLLIANYQRTKKSRTIELSKVNQK